MTLVIFHRFLLIIANDMDENTIKTLKQSLLEEKEKLENDLKEFTHKDESIDDNFKSDFPDYGESDEDNAAEVAEYSDRLSIEHALEEQLRDVNKAIANIEAGTYGICNYCKKPIEEKRLLIRPTSSSCVECKKKLKGE